MKNIKHKLISVAFIALALTSTGCNSETIAKQGIHYSVLPTLSYSIPEVVEIFALSCTHCRMMEELIHNIEYKSESDIQKMHCVYNEKTLNEAYLYYSAAIQTKDQPSRILMDALFAFIQHDVASMGDHEIEHKMTEIFHTYNLHPPKDLSDEETKKVAKLVERDRQLMKDLNLAAVPAIIVKGKYLINMREHKDLNALALTIKELKAI
jgi:thiol-disulfide isomerase/thioredoxin